MRVRTKLIQEGRYAASVEVNFVDNHAGWGPYLSLDDVRRLDEVREALRRGDLRQAAQIGKVYELTPVAI